MKKDILLIFTVLFIAKKSKGINANANIGENEKGNLVSVIALLRHGDRAPYSTFPSDRYFDLAYWPMGHGQLTNKGKERVYQLGKWLRSRYNTFLSEEYWPKDIYVRTTDVDRCLVSAAITLAGIYPQKNSQTWSRRLFWQPIPVHTKPFQEDVVLGMRKECPRYAELYQRVSETEYYKNITESYANFFKYVSEHSGWNSANIEDIKVLHTILAIYKSYNESFLSPWIKVLDKKTLMFLAGVAHERYTHNTELKRLVTGPFWANLFSHFDNAIKNVTDTRKFIMLVSHDTTTVALLNSMDAYDLTPPVFGATLIWELWRTDSGSYYINVLYKRTGPKPDTLTIRGCEVNCNYEEFKKILEPVTVNSIEWEKECANIGYFGLIKQTIDAIKKFWVDERVEGDHRPFLIT